MEFNYSDINPRALVAYASCRAMNTMLEIVLVGLGEAQSRTLTETIGEKVSQLENKFSRHLPDSPIWAINTTGRAQVDDETYMVLELCEAMRQATDGYFDISALSMSGATKPYNTFPQERRIESAREGIVLDLGAFAKGYALEVIKNELGQHNVESALLNFGDSSMAGIGSHPFGEGWTVNVGATEINLRDSSLSVSGLRRDGQAHIVDPTTGQMADGGAVVAVTGRSALVCEVLSTALYAAPQAVGEKILARFDGYKRI